jgi:hypothetical protein
LYQNRGFQRRIGYGCKHRLRPVTIRTRAGRRSSGGGRGTDRIRSAPAAQQVCRACAGTVFHPDISTRQNANVAHAPDTS